ncbi:ABC transporter ATP-binding protein [Sulfitobacter sp. 1A12126]|uniref:ABC transporter ATP-binding protein n=1 Tax=Sulfitobacter sp. 1A12126 TaxID=3368591 RepID=UPI00374621C6
MSDPLLAVDGLRIGFGPAKNGAEAVRGVGFTLEAGKVLGIVGESGSGKSLTMMALLQLLPGQARCSGSARFRGKELIGMRKSEIRHLRGKDIGCVFQDPLSAFNPVKTIGDQIVEAIRLHDRRISRRAAMKEAEELLAAVSIPQPDQRLRQYPHEFSGGMRQRAMIAMAIANKPALLIADEPTTALDVTVQAQILDLLRTLTRERGIGLVLITHDLGVVAGMADNIAVMYGGRFVETGTADEIFYHTRHPYTRGLIEAMPKLDRPEERLVAIEGTPPSIWSRPPGCSFAPRCNFAQERCRQQEPELRDLEHTRSACLRAEELPPRETVAHAQDTGKDMTL